MPRKRNTEQKRNRNRSQEDPDLFFVKKYKSPYASTRPRRVTQSARGIYGFRIHRPNPAIGKKTYITNRDYTKYIKWSPVKIVIFALIFGGLYAGTVIYLFTSGLHFFALSLTVIALLFALAIGCIYWLGKTNF